jgi:hypothetical protein
MFVIFKLNKYAKEPKFLKILLYEGESVDRSQMDINKTCDTRTWEKHLFLEVSSTSIDTPVPSL